MDFTNGREEWMYALISWNILPLKIFYCTWIKKTKWALHTNVIGYIIKNEENVKENVYTTKINPHKTFHAASIMISRNGLQIFSNSSICNWRHHAICSNTDKCKMTFILWTYVVGHLSFQLRNISLFLQSFVQSTKDSLNLVLISFPWQIS